MRNFPPTFSQLLDGDSFGYQRVLESGNVLSAQQSSEGIRITLENSEESISSEEGQTYVLGYGLLREMDQWSGFLEFLKASLDSFESKREWGLLLDKIMSFRLNLERLLGSNGQTLMLS